MNQDENKSTKVHELIKKCLFKDDEIVEGKIPLYHIPVEGIVGKFAFHPERIKAHKEEIRALLNEMPDDFHKHKGGGMSFLNLCMDKHGVHWAEHRTMGELVCLGIAAGMASYCTPRDMWNMFPGGMPYITFDTTEGGEDEPCDHKGSLTFIETSLMSDMTMETVAECSKCKKQMIIKGGKFTPLNEGRYEPK